VPGSRAQALAASASALSKIARDVVRCERCARLIGHCREVARLRVRRFRDETYWGRPVPGFGSPDARLLIVGLAPAAHGANRTGRMFTGDDSGAWLFRSLHGAGFASQAESRERNDGLRLIDAYLTAAARCAPPGNRPQPGELLACRQFLQREVEALPRLRVILALGQIAFQTVLALEAAAGGAPLRPRPRFAHGAEVGLGDGRILLASYHPSRQNTQTGRLTRAMLDRVMRRARDLCARDP
jgi:uracil-DNA glycosylase family 4